MKNRVGQKLLNELNEKETLDHESENRGKMYKE